MATSATVKMFAPPAGGGAIQTQFSGTVYVGTDGTVTVNAQDVPTMVALGYQFAVAGHNFWSTPGAPVAASATVTVSSAALSNGTLTIAAQPDVPRQLAAVVFPGTLNITAGTLTYTYQANDGTVQVDVLSLVMGSQAAGTAGGTLNTTKGVERLISAVVAGLSGGASPGIQVGTNNYLGVPVPPRFVDFALVSEKKTTPTTGSLGLTVGSDDTVSTNLISTGALVSPTTAPDGTHWISFGYTFNSPG